MNLVKEAIEGKQYEVAITKVKETRKEAGEASETYQGQITAGTLSKIIYQTN